MSANHTNNHVSEWLGAYLDGELGSSRRKAVAAHLAVCPLCRNELDELRQLSSLLHTAPQPPMQKSPEQAAQELLAGLPENATQARWLRRLQLFWQATPLILIVVWAFGQAVGWVSSLLLWLPQSGFLSSPLPAILETSTIWGWLLGLPPGLLLLGLDEMSARTGAGGVWDFVLNLNVQWSVLIALLYAAWLASWWVTRRRPAGIEILNGGNYGSF